MIHGAMSGTGLHVRNERMNSMTENQPPQPMSLNEQDTPAETETDDVQGYGFVPTYTIPLATMHQPVWPTPAPPSGGDVFDTEGGQDLNLQSGSSGGYGGDGDPLQPF
jgi:hypothetical protein